MSFEPVPDTRVSSAVPAVLPDESHGFGPATEDLPATVRRSPLRRVPRWLRWTTAGIVGLGVAATFGLTTARADLYLGPHQTEYRLTTDATITANFGPLGTLQVDSPVSPLGVRANVGEIPTELSSQNVLSSDGVSSAEANSLLGGLTDDLSEYVAFFANPQVTVNEVARALVFDAARRTLLAFAALASVTAAVYAILGRQRRAELLDEVGPAALGLGASVTAVAVVTALIAHGGATAGEAETLAAKVFEDTPLAGARVTGEIAAVMDKYGYSAMQIYEDNQAFYAAARESLDEAWEQRLAEDAKDQLAEHDDVVNFLIISDLHCNVSMAELIRDSAEAANAVAIFNLGDTTMSGTEVEKYCVDAINRARPDGMPMVVVDGNHDSVAVIDTERAHGQTILADDVLEIGGVRILGESSPAATELGAGITASKDEIVDLGRQLRDIACDDGDVDLLMVHEPETGDAVMHSGCVPLQISGHTHKRYDPFQIGSGIRYVNSSTAGAVAGKPTVGPLKGTSEMTVLRFDPSQDRFIDWRLIEVHPDATAEVGPYQPMPTARTTAPADQPVYPAGKTAHGTV